MPSADSAAGEWGIIGHDRQVARLQRLASRNTLPGAMLITGAPGVGRKALATALAAAALCQQQSGGVACGACPSCQQVRAGSHPDLQVWSVARQDEELTESAGGVLRIETIRVIAGTTALRPQAGDHRFIIIDDAETLENAAQQAMLKMLEDVPPFLTITLIATSSSALIDTVLSRCVEIPLQLVPTRAIRAALAGPDADEIAARAAGRPGWAIAAMRDPSLLQEERESAIALESWIALSRHERLIEAYRRGDRALDRDRKVAQRERRKLLSDLDRLQRIWRDQVMTAASVSSAVFDPLTSTRIGANLTIDASAAHRALRATVTCHDDILGNVRPRLALQTMVNQWPTQ